jgi:hypothetical protein
MAGVKGRSGGARPGAGWPKGGKDTRLPAGGRFCPSTPNLLDIPRYSNKMRRPRLVPLISVPHPEGAVSGARWRTTADEDTTASTDGRVE